jgi:hypothetical protein
MAAVSCWTTQLKKARLLPGFDYLVTMMPARRRASIVMMTLWGQDPPNDSNVLHLRGRVGNAESRRWRDRCSQGGTRQ